MPTPASTTELYFECHITVDPVTDERLHEFQLIADCGQFRVADLWMKKRAKDTPQRSQYDSFCTARGTDYVELQGRMYKVLFVLQERGFVIRRYKIENTLLDVRLDKKHG